jgi:hypothetical protein
MKPITELESINPGVLANLGTDSEGMGHVANLTTQDPRVFLTLMGIIKATNLNDRGASSAAGDIGVAFSIGFLTAWHICQNDALAEFSESLTTGRADEPPSIETGKPLGRFIPAMTDLQGTCEICHGGGVGGDGTACEHCTGLGFVKLKNVVDASPGGNIKQDLDALDRVLEDALEKGYPDFQETGKDIGHDAEPCDICHGGGIFEGTACAKCFGKGIL